MSDTQVAPAPSSNGNAPEMLEVRNPATGEVIASVPQQSSDQVAEVVARARAAQPAWEQLGYEGRARILRRAQKWTTDNAERIAAQIVAETGKTFEDATLAEVAYAVRRLRLLGKARAQVPGRREGLDLEPVRTRPPARGALPGGRGRRRDRPVELPADKLLRRLHPGARGRQRSRPQAGEPDTADLAADARGAARQRPARGHLPGRRRPRWIDRQRSDRRRRHGHVHRLDRGRQAGDGASFEHGDPRLARARRQGPDDRARRRQPRARRQLGRLLVDAKRRPDLHLDRTRIRRGADLRRVRRQGRGEDARRCARANRPPRAASRSARSPLPIRAIWSRSMSRTRSTRAPRYWSAAIAAQSTATSSSRPCWSTSITR